MADEDRVGVWARGAGDHLHLGRAGSAVQELDPEAQGSAGVV